MTLRDIISAAQFQATKLTGLEAQLVDPRGAYNTSGTVTETPVEYACWATDLRDESRRWRDDGISATVYVTQLDSAARPQPGWRLKYAGRVFTVIDAFPSYIGTAVTQWRLDVGEVAA
jgi:hypothetical protein